MNVYRLTALLILPFYVVVAFFEVQTLGHPRFWLFWLLGGILLLAGAWLAGIAWREEKDEEVSAPELVRELAPATERPVGPGWPTGPETFCARCGGAVPVGATTCEHCGATLPNSPGVVPAH
ncbi:MAG: hypothetical protein L3J87_00460 [Thermoplasmata archaeon]|nr:hypothetical protein [Thermoplasmata archaeon]MCI4344084.1 hypothetical protein [Thermoplasmata archaeon]